MKRFQSFVLGLLVGIASTVNAVNFTLNLTQAQIDIGTWKWNQVDPAHITYTTAQLFGAAMFNQMVDEWKQQRFNARKLYVGGPTGYYCTNTYPGQNQTQRDAVCTSLGDVAGCTVCDPNGN